MTIFSFPARTKKARTLGKAHGKRRYDLPLNRGGSTNFLVVLIGLMTLLAVLAISASFALAAMTDRWTSGLEGRLTIEIPAETAEGVLLTPQDVSALSQTAASVLENYPPVSRFHIMTSDEIQELVKPWLGENTLNRDQLPLPGLISVEMKPGTPRESIDALAEKIKSAAPGARLDTHETWLKDVLRFTGALRFAALLLMIIISITTVIAVAGAVRARLAVHHADVELLHLMGAADHYISSQFQRHVLILGLLGGLAGTIAGALALIIIGWLSGEMDVNLLPDYTISLLQMGAIALLPVVIGLLATVTARQTVLHELSRMT